MAAMPFADDIVAAAWQRSNGVCECMDFPHCHHPVVPHARPLAFEARGRVGSAQGWELHHIDPMGLPALANARILCIDCHKRTPSYGTGNEQRRRQTSANPAVF
jgi:5-methylcytosine-specific restriction endonuclease McrA